MIDRLIFGCLTSLATNVHLYHGDISITGGKWGTHMTLSSNISVQTFLILHGLTLYIQKYSNVKQVKLMNVDVASIASALLINWYDWMLDLYLHVHSVSITCVLLRFTSLTP